MYFKDFSSGAMIENIVRRAKKLAIKRLIAGGRARHPHRRPPRLDRAGVQGARGPAQHHQPRRLGEDLGKKGERIVYVRTLVVPATRATARRRPVHRAGGHRPVPVARLRVRAGGRFRRGDPEGLRHRDRVRHRPPRRRRVQPDRRVVGADQRLRVVPGQRKVGWDFEDESPGNDARGFSRRRGDAARGRDPPRQRRAHQRRPLLRRPRPPRAVDAGVRRRPRGRASGTRRPSASSSSRWRRPRPTLPPGQEIVVHKNNSDGKGNSYGCHENYLHGPGRARSAGSWPGSCRSSSPARSSPAPARSAARRRRVSAGRCRSSSRSGPTSSRRRSGSRRR